MDSAVPLPPPPPLPPAETELPPPTVSELPAPLPEPQVKVTREPKADEPPPLPQVKLDWIGAALSYFIPGLGQVYQGRIGKGLLFFFGLYTLFFYGLWMGQWRNVWLPDVVNMAPLEIAGYKMTGVPSSLYYRPQFLGQFWIGVAAWPAVVQYYQFDGAQNAGPLFGSFQRMPPEGGINDPPERITLNKLQREGNKRWDLGWVYTVIAGVLNLLVIYDALAGPMFREPPLGWGKKDDEPNS